MVFKACAVHKPILCYLGMAWRVMRGLVQGGLGPGVAWGWLGVAGGWPGGGLGRFYYPGTIRESMKYYPGFLGQLAGAGWGWLGLAGAGQGWLGLPRAGWGWPGLAGAA